MAIKDLVPALHRKRSQVPGLRQEADPFTQIQTEMNRLFDDLFALTGAPSTLSEHSLPTTIRVDVSEDDKEVTVTAELPGLDEKDVHVEMDDYAVTISGEKREKKTKRSATGFGGNYTMVTSIASSPCQARLMALRPKHVFAKAC